MNNHEGVDRGWGYGDKVGGIGGGGGGERGRGVWKDWGGKLIFLNRKFREIGSFRPISYIKVHQGKHAYLCGLFCHTTHIMYGARKISA